MFMTSLGRLNKWIFYSLSVLSLTAGALYFSAMFKTSEAQAKDNDRVSRASPSATFPGTNLGAIPDNACGVSDREVMFNVTGMSGRPASVEVNMTFNPIHTFAGDVDMELIAPNGTRHWLQSYTGGQGGDFGDGSDLAGAYTFSDSAPAAPTWWTAAFLALSTQPIPAGSYRTQQPGPFANDDPGPPITNMTAAFNAIPDTNGIWKLVVGDCSGGDTGSVSQANLTLTSVTPTKPNADFTGDGKTDYSQVRNVTPAIAGSGLYRAESVREKQRILSENPPEQYDELVPGTNLRWFINNSSSLGTNTIINFGEPTSDFVVPSDYDGDGKADIAIWRVGAPTVAAFYILRSTNMTIRTELFGQTGDDPAITGDYDGDGKSDVAVQRCPPIGSPGQCFFFYRGSFNNPSGNVTYVEWGFGQMFDLFASPGDFDGDGKFDFCIQRTHPNQPGNGQFVLLRSSDFGVEYINWGRNTDFIVPGDYDGDGKYDFMVSRTEDLGQGSGRSYYLLTRTGGGTGAVPIRWGIAGDIRTPGDFDGDAITDIAIWRPTAGSGTSTYYVRRSSDLTLQTFQYGLQGDAAVPNWVVH